MTIDPDKINKQNVAYFKKLMQSQGKLALFYYLAAAGKPEDHRVSITLAAKDKKGTKCLGTGKKLKADAKGATKWSFGSVELDGKKFVLKARRGQLGPAQVRKAIREYGKEISFSPLAKANAQSGDSAPPPEEDGGGSLDTEASEAFDDVMSTLDGSEILAASDLEALLSEQGELTELNAQISTLFADDDDEAFEAKMMKLRAEEVGETLRALEHADGDEKRRLQAQLAQQVYIGEDIPPPPEALTPEQGALMDASMEVALAMLDDQLSRLLKTVQGMESDVSKRARAPSTDELIKQRAGILRTLAGYEVQLTALEKQREQLAAL